MTTPDDTTTWLTRPEAASRARVALRTVDNWLADGALTKHVSGLGRVRIDAAELDTFLAPRPAGSDTAATA